GFLRLRVVIDASRTVRPRRSHTVTLPPFQRVLDEHRDDVHRFLMASAGPNEADDAFQETFIAALRAYPRLRPDSNVRGWLLTIAHRKAIDAHRARGRRAVPVVEVDRGGAEDPARTGRPLLRGRRPRRPARPARRPHLASRGRGPCPRGSSAARTGRVLRRRAEELRDAGGLAADARLHPPRAQGHREDRLRRGLDVPRGRGPRREP